MWTADPVNTWSRTASVYCLLQTRLDRPGDGPQKVGTAGCGDVAPLRVGRPMGSFWTALGGPK